MNSAPIGSHKAKTRRYNLSIYVRAPGEPHATNYYVDVDTEQDFDETFHRWKSAMKNGDDIFLINANHCQDPASSHYNTVTKVAVRASTVEKIELQMNTD